jgi:predicted XRE-type DNA-binding protein
MKAISHDVRRRLTPDSGIEDLIERRLKQNGEKQEKITMTRHHNHEPVEQGSNNIFADLGFSNPEEHLAKAGLAMQIIEIIRQCRLSQAAVGILGIDQPKVSALMRGQLKNFSLDRLCRFLNRLDKDVDIVGKDKPRSRTRGETHIISRTRSVRRQAAARG